MADSKFPLSVEAYIKREVTKPGHIRLWLIAKIPIPGTPKFFETKDIFFSGTEAEGDPLLQKVLLGDSQNSW